MVKKYAYSIVATGVFVRQERHRSDRRGEGISMFT